MFQVKEKTAMVSHFCNSSIGEAETKESLDLISSQFSQMDKN